MPKLRGLFKGRLARLNILGAVTAAAIAAGVFIAAQLASGDPVTPGDLGPPPDAPTPAPPSPIIIPPNSDIGKFTTPGPQPPVNVNGVEIAVPAGAEASGGLGPNLRPDFRSVQRGKSRISWSSKGIEGILIAPEDEADFQPFVDALRAALAQAGGQ